MSQPIFPNVKVRLSGQDGNALSIIGRVTAALRRAGATTEQQEAFAAEAMFWRLRQRPPHRDAMGGDGMTPPTCSQRESITTPEKGQPA
mgnify:CR=1 FL=1